MVRPIEARSQANHAPQKSTWRKEYPDHLTLILETDFITGTGAVRLTDFMAPQTLESDVFRLIECLEGQVELESRLSIRFDCGSILPWIQRLDRGVRLQVK